MDARQTPEEASDDEDRQQQRHAEPDPHERARWLERRVRVLETTLSHIPDFACIFGRHGRFIYANQALLDLWGLTPDEAVGKNFFDLNYPHDLAQKLQRQIQQVFDTGQGLTDVTPYTSPAGKGGYYEYIFRPVRTR